MIYLCDYLSTYIINNVSYSNLMSNNKFKL